jgi:hypothetical protein
MACDSQPSLLSSYSQHYLTPSLFISWYCVDESGEKKSNLIQVVSKKEMNFKNMIFSSKLDIISRAQLYILPIYKKNN